MLQVQNVTVEVGGKNVVQGATFTVMARDKVGIVGRNGAGKTSMFRVLGGENDPAAGKVMRSGAFGYLSQDPRTSPEQEARSAIGHVLSGRNIDADLARLEKLRVVMEKDPSDKNVAKFSKAEEEFTLKGGYSANIELTVRAVADVSRRRNKPVEPRPVIGEGSGSSESGENNRAFLPSGNASRNCTLFCGFSITVF